ncbi:hypothetical protein COD78_31080 [Bacillus cereus]|uniref:Uncharacterized protein n=1 Tax=Bacillus cereus TaxID=1396 RepID=A0A9X6VRN7_BACCE|nr:hypothetical protein BK713_05890 [Bacillus thuringiensis serovar jinghongiensis]OTX24187.1 hypothetical protein BK715_03745 [Bacillus thuringiensis serovar japonensis]PDZ75908.1 hypothetical protein CON31_30670 [Bacillus cereus]PEC03454.1 hypothetical protein COM98_18535 [Bacillus cereus]PEV55700.1 hypothetical protein CN423_30240 [Bacillus cereus]
MNNLQNYMEVCRQRERQKFVVKNYYEFLSFILSGVTKARMERKIDKEFKRATQMLAYYEKQAENLMEYLMKRKCLCTLIQQLS